MNISEEFTFIAVPNKHVPAVYRFIAELTERDDLVEPDSLVPAETQSGTPFWTLEKLALFASDRSKTAVIMGEILDLLADRPERRLTIDELAKETERPRSQIKMIWTHLGRILRARYGTKDWPVTAKWAVHMTPRPEGPNVVYYWLTDEQAELWKQARDSSREN